MKIAQSTHFLSFINLLLALLSTRLTPPDSASREAVSSDGPEAESEVEAAWKTEETLCWLCVLWSICCVLLAGGVFSLGLVPVRLGVFVPEI